MLLTNQQMFILEALEALGGARMDQLASLLRPVFCERKPDIAERVTDTAIRQMLLCNLELYQENDLIYLPGRRPTPSLVEAVDVMLELSAGTLLSYHPGRAPLLLRFTVQGQKVRMFCVTTQGADLLGIELNRKERIIQLFDGQSQIRALPVPNKQFCAVQQSDGTHRFFAVNGQN